MEKHIDLPINNTDLENLRAGDFCYLTGTLYTARDAAHKRMAEALDKGEELPMDIKGQALYYLGPTPPRPGRVMGSAGPTTSGRMDKYTPRLLDMGLSLMIGKGKRNDAVKEAMIRNGAVYMACIGGAGAILSRSIKNAEIIAYEDLGTEAIRKLYVEDLPAIVVMDAAGGNLYKDF